MLETPLSYLIISAIILFIIALFFVVFMVKRKLEKLQQLVQSQQQAYEIVLNETKHKLGNRQNQFDEKFKALDSWQVEQQQVSQQLEHRIKVLQQKYNDQQELINQLQSQQPEDKLYIRAQKMVALGADVEEVIRECDIPKAEAEMLVAMHQKQKKV